MQKLFVCGVFAALTACGGAQPAPTTPRVFGATHLDHIPDDAPFVVVSDPAEPSAFFARQRALVAADFDALLQRIVAAPPLAADATPAERALRGLAQRLADAKAPTHWRALGLFEPTPLALYSAEHALVARLDIKQPAGLRALVEGASADAGIPLRASQEGEFAVLDLELRVPELDMPHVLVVIGPRDARLGVTTSARVDALREHLLDRRDPARSLLDTGRLAQLSRAEGLGEESVLSVDVPAVIEGLDLGACQADVARFFDGLTHIYAGAQGTQDGATAITKLRFSPAAMTTLASVMRPSPRLSPAGDASLYAFSLGFDLAGLRGYAQSVADALKAKPLTCEPLVGLNESLNALPVQALTPTPLDGLDGLAVELHHIDIKASKFVGALMVGARDPKALLTLVPFGLAAGFAPGLQTPEVGGPVQHVPLVGQLETLGTLHLGAGPRGVALGVGALPQGAFEGLLAQPVTGADEPWIRLVVDSAAARLMSAGQEDTAAEGSDTALGLSKTRMVVERRGDDLVIVSSTQGAPEAAAPKP